MHATTTTDRLLEALRLLRGVVPTRTTLPVLSHVLVEAAEGRVLLTGTDLDNRLALQVPAEVSEPGSVAVPLDRLGHLLKTTAGGQVDFHCATDALQKLLLVETSEFTVALYGQGSGEFSTLRVDGEPSRSFSLPAGTIRRIRDAVQPHTSTDESRPILHGVALQWQRGGMWAVGVNGHQLVALALTDPDADSDVWAKDGEVILRPGAFSFLGDDVPDDAQVQIRVCDRWIQFEVGDVLLSTLAIEGPFPNWRQVVPNASEAVCTVTVEREATLAAFADRVVALYGTYGQHYRMDLSFDPAEEQAIATAHAPDTGRIRQAIPAECAGRPIGVSLNADKLAAVLGSLRGPDVRISITGVERSVLFEDPADPHVRAILMPLLPLDGEPSEDAAFWRKHAPAAAVPA